ncbi:MAG: hypothetical protein ABT940_07455 [Alphaproteobacteria bacterium]
MEISGMMYGLTIVAAVAAGYMIRGSGAGGGAESHGAAGASPKAGAAPASAAVGLDGGEIAAIAAAVYAVLGSHRIVRIESAGGSGWVNEGRMMHHASHSLSRHTAQH